MRKLAWLTLFAAAALFFGAPENAFAHPNHHHTAQTQSAPVQKLDTAAPAAEHTGHFDEVVSASQPQTDKCPHGEKAECTFCCAGAGSASVALVIPDAVNRAINARGEVVAASASYYIRQTILDLSRPPKSFV
jgi:hypothetical protein